MADGAPVKVAGITASQPELGGCCPRTTSIRMMLVGRDAAELSALCECIHKLAVCEWIHKLAAEPTAERNGPKGCCSGKAQRG